ncbi:MAG: gliding motility-associated C-terminal domain-containing protein [Bacteroidales bacterium]|nr:gliding motility-associated C-terminal domain-containing protein [Bacteroidales bacterium]
MQKLFTFILLLIFAGAVHAQVFWTEDFGTGCNQGQLANAVAGSNGTWAITSTGTNSANANTWYISAAENGNPAGSCGSGCGSDRTLHLGNIELLGGFIAADGGASYYAGGLGDPTTNIRAESPTINCTGRSNITVDFVYMEYGDGTNDNATMWYYDGSTWALLIDLPKTPFGSCSPQGLWTAYSINLPATANNNANVKIGFNWTNNADNAGTDPSFAVDDISLSVPSAGTPPIADFDVSDTTLCVGDCITFTDLSSNTPTGWSWTFPGGTPGSSGVQNPGSICYNITGDYEAKLVVTNASGSDSITQMIHVFDYPTAAISANDTTICFGDNVTLTASGGGTYLWGGSQTSSVINETPTGNTTYTVTVTTNGCSESASLDIFVNPLPLVNITGTNSICDGDTTTLTGNNADSYAWSTIESTPSIDVHPTTDTWYYVTGTDINGCVNTDSIEVTVNPTPTAVINGPGAICVGDTATLTASGGIGSYTYAWNGGGGTSSIDVNPTTSTNYYVTVSAGSCSDSASYTLNVDTLPIIGITGDAVICENDTANLAANGGLTGNYVWSYLGLTTDNINVTPSLTTTYIVTGSDGNCSNTATFMVTVNPAPNIIINGTTSICDGDSTTLTASGATTYSWSNGGSNASTTVSPTGTTTYTVSGTSGGCEGTASVQVTVNPLPNASINGDTVICFGETATLTSSGGSTYLWNTTQTTSSIGVNPTNSQTYTVTVSNGPCADTASIFVLVHPLPLADAGNDTTILYGSPAYLNGSGGITYSWSPDDDLSCNNCSDPTATPETSTQYTLLVTDANGCSNSDEVWVFVEYNCGDIFIPTAFSPNNDGYNDILIVRGNCIETIVFKVFDRWGEKVFETKVPGEGWDGTFKGQAMNGGVFSLYYSGTQIDGTTFSGQGTVTLIR